MPAKTQVTIQKLHTYTGHKDAVYALEQGASDSTFFSSGSDGLVIEWDLNNFESGRLIAKISSSVYALHYTESLDLLIIGQNYEGIHLINAKDLKVAGSLKLTKNAIFDIKLFNDTIIVAAGDGELFFINRTTLQIIKKTIIAEKNLRTLFITHNEKCLVGTSDGHMVQIDLNSLRIDTEIQAHEKSVFSIESSNPDAPYFITGGRDAKLIFWTADNLQADESINAHMYAINDISFHSSGKHFATASMDKTIKIWDYEKRKLIKVIDKARHQGHLSSVNKVIWTKFKDYLISCSDDRSISVWSIEIEK